MMVKHRSSEALTPQISAIEVFVTRPVVAISFCLLIMLAGIKSSLEMTVSEFPQIESAALRIHTTFVGASADEVKSFITIPIEEAVSNVSGIDYVDSVTKAGSSIVTVWLNLNEHVPDALAEISTSINRIKYKIPSGAYDPQIEIIRADRPWASFYLPVILSDGMSRTLVTDYLERNVVPVFSAIPNVRKSEVIGGRAPAIRVWLKPELLESNNVSASDIRRALLENNIVATLGKTQNSDKRVDLFVNSLLTDLNEFESLVVRQDVGDLVRLRDVAEVELDEEEGYENTRFSQDDSVFLSVWPAPGANEIDIADRLYDEVDKLNGSLPPEMQIRIGYDSTKYTRKAIKEIFITLLETILLVGAVVVVFMGSFRTAVVPLIAIPISILGAVASIYALGFSFNLLTILAIVLSVGLVVDDAIVVVENVSRLVGQGMTGTEAAIKSTRQLFSPIVTMTLTLAMVFIPISFLSGLTGALFREFALTLAIAVTISGVVAITLSPAMSAFVCHRVSRDSAGVRFVTEKFDRVRRSYASMLSLILEQPGCVLVVYIFCLFLLLPLYNFSKKELAPIEDTGALMMVISAPPDASLEYTTKHMQAIVESLESLSGGQFMWQRLDQSGGFAGKTFVDEDKRTFSVMEMLPDAFRRLSSVPALKSFPTLETSLPTAGNFAVELVVQSTDSQQKMLSFARQILEEARARGKFIYLDTDLIVDLPEANIIIDRNKAFDLGLSAEDINVQLSTLLSGDFISQVNLSGRAYDVIPMVTEQNRTSPTSLMNLKIKTSSGVFVPVSDFASEERKASPRSLGRFDQKNAFRVFGAVVPGVTKEEGLAALEEVVDAIVPNEYSMNYAGESRQLRSEGNSLAASLGLAIIIVFFILSVQFNNFREPIIILLGSVPLAIMSALIFTFMDMTTINVYSQIGLITLAGLGAKNAILIIQFANRLKIQGMSSVEAIKQSADERLRPVLMTTGATVFGHLPLVFVTGAGAEARNSIGIVLVAGMAVGTIFTLMVLPSIYLWITKETSPPTQHRLTVA